MDGSRAQAITIPVYRPDLGGNEARYVADCLASSWISSRGDYLERFERDFARFVGCADAAAVCNGTAALHLTLLALGIGAGDEVIVPALTFVATANAVTYTGARPVFADVRPDTWQLDAADVARRITARTKAVIAVHLYGHACDLDALQAVCSVHGLQLVEDCAEAIGTLYKGRHVGTFGALAAFSFFGNKTLTTGEGGMVVGNDAALMRRVRHLRGQGLAAGREYWHDAVGYNYRMTNLCAAIGVAQLERAHVFLARKRALAEQYRLRLRDLPLTVHGEHPDVRHSYWMVSVLVEDAADRDPLRAHMAAQGVETRPLFHPLHTLPIYAADAPRLAVAEDLARRGLNLPSWPGLTDAQVDRVVEATRGYFARRYACRARRSP